MPNSGRRGAAADGQAAPRVSPQGPLAGVRVVEFAGLGPAPFAAMMLADMGAEVVEIVRPATPAPSSTDFVARRRRRIELDLKNPAGVAAAAQIASLADVLIEGFRPGVMERLGLGPDDIMERHRGLVYGRMTGWGQYGALARTVGHDINYIAVAGALHCMRSPDGEPVVPLNLVGDLGGGALYLVVGILAALFDRTRTGRGQVVDAAICDGVAHMLTTFYSLRSQGLWSSRTGVNILDGGAPFYRAYRCADGAYIAIGALEPKFYEALIAGLGLDHETLPAQTDAEGWERLSRRIGEKISERTRDEWVTQFHGSDACVAPVLSLEEVPRHPHMRDRGDFFDDGSGICPAPAPKFSAYPSPPPQAPAEKVEDAVEILQEWTRAYHPGAGTP